MKKIVCPVCGNKIDGSFCLECGYDANNDVYNQISLTPISQEKLNERNQRIKIKKEIYQQQKLTDAIDELIKVSSE